MTPSYSDPPGLNLPPINVPPAYGLEEENSFSLSKLTSLVRRRWWIILLVGFLAGGFFLKQQLDKPPIFQTSFQLLVSSPDSPNVNPLSQLEGAGLLNLPKGRDYIATQTQILQSNTLIAPVWEEVYGSLPREEQISFGDFVRNLSVVLIPDTGIIEISYRGNSQETVQTVLEALASAYLNYTKEERDRRENEKLGFVREQLPKFQSRVEQLQSQLTGLQKQYEFFNPLTTGETLSATLAETNRQKQTVLVRIQQLTAKKNALEQKTGVDDTNAFNLSSLGQSPVYAGLVERLNQINLGLAEATTIYTENSIQVEQLELEKANVLQLIQREVNQDQRQVDGADLERVLASTDVGGPKAEALQELSGVAIELEVLNIELENLIRAENQLTQQLQQFTTVAGQYANIEQELNLQKEGMTQLIASRQALEIEATSSYIPWRLVSTITPPGRPIDTLPQDVLISLLLGLVAGGGAAFLVDKLDPTYHDPQEIQDNYNVGILGYIPLEKQLRSNIREGAYLRSESFYEAYTKLYSNLFFLKRKQQCHSFVITSPESQDGKSTTAFFLAFAAAKLGQKVLLVDGDRYFPQREAWMKLAKITGSQKVDPDGVAPLLSESEEYQNGNNGQFPEPLGKNLSYVKVQDETMTPEQLISASENFVVKLEEWKATFDLILIDTPPILGLTDSRLIADKTDGLVMVIRLGKTRKESIREAFKELAMADLNVLGVVANTVTKASGGYSYYGRYYNRYYNQNALVGSRPVTRS